MQGKGGDIFLFNGNTTTMKEQLITWTKIVKSGNFLNFPGLEIFLKTSNWDHLYLLSKNFFFVFC